MIARRGMGMCHSMGHSDLTRWKMFPPRGGQTLEQGVWQGVYGDGQNLTRHNPGQPGTTEPALSGGLDYLTST